MRINLSIRSFLVLLAISFTIPAVLLFGFIEATSGVQQSREQSREMNRQAALLVQQDIAAFVEQFKVLSAGLSVDIDFETLRFSHPDRIARILKQYPGIALLILNQNAASVASYAADRQIPVGIDYGDRDYIRQAIETRQTSVSGAIQSRTANTPAVVFCVPLIDPNGSLKGFLGAGIPTALFQTAHRLPLDQFAIVVDTFGTVVYTNNIKEPDAVVAAIAKAPFGESRFTEDQTDDSLYSDEVKPIGWKVIVGVPESYITARAREAIGRAIAVGLLCTLIGAAIASVVAFSTVRGLDGIAQQVQQMSAANLRPIQFTNTGMLPREVRSLVNNFNNLLDRTARAHQAEFEAISRVADTILIVQGDGHITYANEAGAKLFGNPVGKRLGEILGDEPAAAIRSEASPHEWKGDVSVTKADGTIFDAFVSSSAILENDQLTSIVLIVQDITREKAAREAFAHSEKMITLGELVAGTSHELNNPLAIVAGYADLLLEEDNLSPDQRSKIQSVRKNAVRAANVVHSLLAFARKRKPERVRTDLNAVIEAAIQLKEYDIVTSGIRLDKQLAASLPPVFADPHQIQQVLLNVINNAQDAVLGSANTPTIVVRSETADGKVRVRIEDSGVGISKADLKKVFDPFFTTKPLGKGTGLGLSISYGIIREHGGEIHIQSQAGQGTQVCIELAVDEGRVSAPAGVVSAVRATGGKTFLVVDDEPEIVAIVSKALMRHGSHVDCASSFEEALELAKKNEYDFVITDVKMPRGSGIDLYKQLCVAKPSYRRRVVFLTGDINNPATTQFLERESLAYFAKPFDFAAMEEFLMKSDTRADE
jgi:signal transduction histidine kinase/ActR/RegA family two-component response regulator